MASFEKGPDECMRYILSGGEGKIHADYVRAALKGIRDGLYTLEEARENLCEGFSKNIEKVSKSLKEERKWIYTRHFSTALGSR